MSSWVRYCVAVYIGLLLSGALARPPWAQTTPPMTADDPAGQRLEPTARPIDAVPHRDNDARPGTTAGRSASATLSM